MTLDTNPVSLMLCDVGNTSIKIGFADLYALRSSYTLPLPIQETADSLGLKLLGLLDHAGIGRDKLHACLISSVRPAMDPILERAIEKYICCDRIFIPGDMEVPLHNHYPRPWETGADRLVAAYAGRRLFPHVRSLLVVDFGTAITFDGVCDNDFLGGLIFPGPGICSSALAQKTAKLPFVPLEISQNEPQIGLDTGTSIQHGLHFGYKYLVEGLCGMLKASLPAPVKVVATGKFAESLEKISDIFDAVVPSLVLDGLRNLYYIQKQDYSV